MATHEANPFTFDRRTFGVLSAPGTSPARPLRFRRQRAQTNFAASATPPRFQLAVTTPSGPGPSGGSFGPPPPGPVRSNTAPVGGAVSIARRDGRGERRERTGDGRTRGDATRTRGGDGPPGFVVLGRRGQNRSGRETPSEAPPRYSTLSSIGDGPAIPTPSPPAHVELPPVFERTVSTADAATGAAAGTGGEGTRSRRRRRDRQQQNPQNRRGVSPRARGEGRLPRSSGSSNHRSSADEAGPSRRPSVPLITPLTVEPVAPQLPPVEASSPLISLSDTPATPPGAFPHSRRGSELYFTPSVVAEPDPITPTPHPIAVMAPVLAEPVPALTRKSVELPTDRFASVSLTDDRSVPTVQGRSLPRPPPIPPKVPMPTGASMSAPPTSYAFNPPMTVSAVDGTIDGFFDGVAFALAPVQMPTSNGHTPMPTPRSPGIGPPTSQQAPPAFAQPPPPPQPQPQAQPLAQPFAQPTASAPQAQLQPGGQPFSSSYLLVRPCRTQRVALDFDPWRDADLCLRSRDGTLIPCHGANLASASPLLAHLVTNGAADEPRQVTDGVGAGGAVEVKEGLPVYDLNDDGHVLTLMLNYVYPRPAPSLSSLRFGTVKALFAASRRYEVWRAIDASVAQLKTLCPAQPFVVYAIAMAARQESLGPRGGKVALHACEALAKAASFHTLRHDLSSFNKAYFASLSGVAAHALWALHTNRLASGKDIILSTPFTPDPGHAATCTEHKLMERYWAEEARRVAEELKPELDMQRKVVIREPTGAGCLQCYRSLLRTAATVRAKWEKVPNTVIL